MSFQVYDARLTTPFTMIVAGPSQAGKSSFVINLLSKWENMVNTPLDYIVWCYGQMTKDLEVLKQLYSDKITLVEGVPDDLNKYILGKEKHGVVIFDDSQGLICDSQEIADLFTKRSHHENVSAIAIFQNLICEGKHRKTIYRNASYLVLFNTPLDYSLAYSTARKIYPHKSSVFLDIYKKATELPYSFLFIDGKVGSLNEARFRTDIFNPKYQKVFIPTQ